MLTTLEETVSRFDQDELAQSLLQILNVSDEIKQGKPTGMLIDDFFLYRAIVQHYLSMRVSGDIEKLIPSDTMVVDGFKTILMIKY